MTTPEPMTRNALQAIADTIQRHRAHREHQDAAADGTIRQLVARIPMEYAEQFGWAPLVPVALEPPDGAHTTMSMHRETYAAHQTQDAALRQEAWAALPADLRRQVRTA